MEEAKIAVAVAAFCISLASFIVAYRASARARKAEVITHLLGDKETVAFAALKILRDGLPPGGQDRTLLLTALVQACVFTSSDRARALLYRVVELNRDAFRQEFETAARALGDTFSSMDAYKFEPDELDLGRGRRRLDALTRVIASK